MDPKRSPDGPDEVETTLGDVVDAGSETAIQEQDWARLVEAIAARDQQALRILFERTHRIVFTLVVRICGNRELAEEVTADVFHDVWRRAVDYEPKNGSVIGWIMMQARSRAIDRMRLEHRKKRVDPHAHAGDDELVEVRHSPAELVVAQQRRELLHAALTGLTPGERAAIETAFFSELTYSETAGRLDQPLGTVKTRVRSALAKLRKALREGERS